MHLISELKLCLMLQSVYLQLCPLIKEWLLVKICHNCQLDNSPHVTCHMTGVHQTLLALLFIHKEKIMNIFFLLPSLNITPPGVILYVMVFNFLLLSTSTIKQYNIKARISATNYQIPL